MIVPTLRVGMPLVTLCDTLWDAERLGLHSHAERGNDQPKKRPRICEAFYFGFNLFNFAASIPVKVRT
jgi:hypothetical protein